MILLSYQITVLFGCIVISSAFKNHSQQHSRRTLISSDNLKRGYLEEWKKLFEKPKDNFISESFVLPYLRALGTTNVCFKETNFFVLNHVHINCDSLRKHGAFLHYTDNNDYTVDDRGFQLVKGIVTNTKLEGEFKIEPTPIHKYCQTFKKIKGPIDENKVFRIEGVTALLTEKAANINIGHEIRADLFLAHLLQCFKEIAQEINIKNQILNVHLYDFAHPKMSSHRKIVTDMLLNNSIIIPSVYTPFPSSQYKDYFQLFKEEKKEIICFDHLIQKIAKWSGDSIDAIFYRKQAYKMCEIDENQPIDTIFIEMHNKDRLWYNITDITHLIKQRKFSHGMKIVVKNLINTTFCDQVRLYSRTRLALMNHGAAVAGNSIFLPSTSVAVEVWEKPEKLNKNIRGSVFDPFDYIDSTPNEDYMRRLSLNYIGACIGFYHQCTGSYESNMLKPECFVQLDRRGFNSVLYVLQKVFYDGLYYEDSGFIEMESKEFDNYDMGKSSFFMKVCLFLILLSGAFGVYWFKDYLLHRLNSLYCLRRNVILRRDNETE